MFGIDAIAPACLRDVCVMFAVGRRLGGMLYEFHKPTRYVSRLTDPTSTRHPIIPPTDSHTIPLQG